jgi:nucleoside-diphosphate-sugar epimerase
VGQNLSRFLVNEGLKVHPLKRGSQGAFTWESLSSAKLNGIDTIIHLAGKAHDTKNISAANEYFETNTGLTKKLFDHFIESEATAFIFMSSVKAAADVVNGILTEDVEPTPKTPYGQSKQKAEEYILSEQLPGGKRVFVLRPCMIHGPGNKGNLNLLYKIVQKGIPYPLAAFKNERSFLSVDNLSFVITNIIRDKTIPGGIYNLADDVPLPTNKVISIIAEVNGKKPRLWKVGTGLMKSFAKAGDKLRLPLNSERLKKLTESYVVSNTKIKEALHITHLPISSEDGLRLTIQSFHSA